MPKPDWNANEIFSISSQVSQFRLFSLRSSLHRKKNFFFIHLQATIMIFYSYQRILRQRFDFFFYLGALEEKEDFCKSLTESVIKVLCTAIWFCHGSFEQLAEWFANSFLCFLSGNRKRRVNCIIDKEIQWLKPGWTMRTLNWSYVSESRNSARLETA